MADNVTEYVCPACGSSLKFNAAEQNIKCPYCDSEFDIKELANFAEDQATTFEENTNWDTTNANVEFTSSEQEGMSSFLCDACGGEIICGPNTSSTSCPYCGNNVLVKGNLSGALKPKYIIPFKKTDEDAKKALQGYLKGKLLLPKVFKSENKLNEIKPLYVPYWLYDSDVDARIVYKGTRTRRWSDSNYNYCETKYYSITREGEIAYEHLPVDASKSIDNKLTEAIEPYDFSEAKEFTTAYLAGYMSDKYDVTAEENSARATERIKQGTQTAFRNTVSGYETLTVDSCNIQLKNTNADYALYPLYILSTKWNNEIYTFAMNGETGKIKGNLPMSKAKYFTWLFSLIGGFALIGLIISLVADTFGWLLGFLCIGILLGFLITGGMKKKLKGVTLQYGSSAYYKQNSLKMKVSKEHFLYQQTTRSARPKSNTSK